MASRKNTAVLDLSRAPSTLFLFGLSGSGKSYVADLIGRHAGWNIYHADDDISSEMQLALENAQPFTDDMRDSYFQRLVVGVRRLQNSTRHLVVTQGAYKRRNREYLQRRIPDMQFIWVTAPDPLIESRIGGRSEGITLASAAALRRDFEPPVDSTKILINDRDDASLIEQLNDWYSLRACL